MRNHTAATVDHHRLTACADPAVVGQALDFREIHRSSEKADQISLRVQDWDGDHHSGDAGIAARTNHVRIFGPDSLRVEHILDVVPDAVVDTDAGRGRRRHRMPGQVPDVELQQCRLSGVRRRQCLVQVHRVEAGIVQACEARVVIRLEL